MVKSHMSFFMKHPNALLDCALGYVQAFALCGLARGENEEERNPLSSLVGVRILKIIGLRMCLTQIRNPKTCVLEQLKIIFNRAMIFLHSATKPAGDA